MAKRLTETSIEAQSCSGNASEQFMAVVSQELQTLQSVIEEASTRINKIQLEIANTGYSPRAHVSGHNYSMSKRLPQHSNPDVPPEEAATRRIIEESSDNTNLSRHPLEAIQNSGSVVSIKDKSSERPPLRVTEDPDLQGKEDITAQFHRIDASKNDFISAQELCAIAMTNGQQVGVKSVVNALEYLNRITASVDESGQAQAEMDVKLFVLLRAEEEAIIEQAPPDVAATLRIIKRALEDESEHHMFETNKAKFNQRQRTQLLKEAMDIGIVVVIAVNAIVIGISTDHPENTGLWEILEIVFFVIYLAEFLVKNIWWGTPVYFSGPDRNWNWFDFACLIISAVELLVKVFSGEQQRGQSQLNLLKVLRLARLFRLVRIMRFKMFKELKLMAMGLLSGIRALIWAIVLLMVVIYTISIITKSFFGDTHIEFSTVGAGMFTLFRCFTEACETYEGNPIPELLYVQSEHRWLFQLGYVLVTMLVTVGLFNLIMAVFIDNVTKSQNQRKQKELGESAIETEVKLKMLLARFINEPAGDKPALAMMDRFSEDVTSKLTNLTDIAKKRHQLEQRVCADEAFKLLKECNINITRGVFQAWLQDAEFVRVLEEADVDISNKFELFNILDVDLGGELSPHELLTGLLSLRGEVSKGDVIYILLRVRDMTHRLDQLQQGLQSLGRGGSPGW
ncbi:unnamed protein product [Effrenium voratum]|uniref:EF-hand domain-containing protein n=1 Tax=Effrenium voratum TaxID=2562239 RepID=A0AA36NI60_9DINO|nr:unnamed protein product [Effrenium voratum]CAJ1416983.1 unnamed protein product [Effrenium voratum]